MQYLLSDIPTSFVVIFSLIFGVIIGSFLNVYIYRFHTGKSLMGSSHCLSCGNPLSSFELVPLLSYLMLWGRCRACSSYIPVRYFLVELLTGVLFVTAVLTATDIMMLIHTLIIISILVVIAVYDMYHMVIPDDLVFSLMCVVMSSQLYLLITGMAIETFAWNIGAALMASFFFITLWKVSKGTWIGFGDVKLIIPLTLSVGYLSAFSMVVMSFWIGAVIGIAIIMVQKFHHSRQPHLRFLSSELTLKSAVPFAPFLILGYLAVLFFGVDVVSLLTYGA